MTKKREKEETMELKVPGDTLPCCSEKHKIPSTTTSSGGHVRPPGSNSDRQERAEAGPRSAVSLKRDPGGEEALEAPPAKRSANRCSGCRKRVGLTGFRCRCGELFCWEHRYSDRHDCSYDYKAAGRAAIVRENPVVKAAKLVKV